MKHLLSILNLSVIFVPPLVSTIIILIFVKCINSADNARNNSERVRNEAVRLMRDREDKTVLTQRDADRRIGERLHDVTFWRSELQVHFLSHFYFYLN